jgi:hypothetical protein
LETKTSEAPAVGERCTENSAIPDSKVYWTVVLESGQTVVEVPQQRQGVAGALGTAAGWLPAASASRTVVSGTLAAASGTRPDEPESERMRQLCPELVSASKPPVSPRPGSTS